MLAALIIACLPKLISASYSNATLTSDDGNLEVVVYLPVGIKPTEKTYYVSSRFEHGSMIGSIKRTSRELVGEEVVTREHILFDGAYCQQDCNEQFVALSLPRCA